MSLPYLKKYATFNNEQELNYHVKEHTNKNYYEMNESQRQVLQAISQYAINDNGACHLKVETIAQAINKSVITVIRAIRKLVELQIIEKLPTLRRVTGGQGANIYRILPYVTSNDRAEVIGRSDDADSTTTRDRTPIVGKETANLLIYKSIKKTYVPNGRHRPYNAFKSSIHTFLGDSINDDTNGNKRLLYRLYGVYLSQTKALRKAYCHHELMAYGVDAIRVTFTATKRMDIRNIAGYFNGVLSNMLDELCTFEMTQGIAM